MTSPDGINVQTAAEASRLQELNADVQNRDDLERDITRKVSLVSSQTPLDTDGL